MAQSSLSPEFVRGFAIAAPATAIRLTGAAGSGHQPASEILFGSDAATGLGRFPSKGSVLSLDFDAQLCS